MSSHGGQRKMPRAQHHLDRSLPFDVANAPTINSLNFDAPVPTPTGVQVEL